MNQLSKDYSYPFMFFNQAAFPKEQVLEHVYTTYEYASQGYYEDLPVCTGKIARNSYLYFLAMYGRISTLNEVYDIGRISGWHPEHFANAVIDLYEQCDGDFVEMMEYTPEMFSYDETVLEYLRYDIAKALDEQHVFFVNSEIDYHALVSMKDYYDIDGHPFAKENADKLFRNIPIVRVW